MAASPADTTDAVSQPGLGPDTPDDFTDLTLVVEDRRLYTCKAFLAAVSPVWRALLTSDFKEKDAGEIPLPGKRFSDILELLMCVNPAGQRDISEDNVMTILPLADEYQMGKLKKYCENWLLNRLDTLPPGEAHVQYLMMAQKYSLERLLKRAVEDVSHLSVKDLESSPDFASIEPNTAAKIFRRRALSLETEKRTLEQKSKDSKLQLESENSALKREKKRCRQEVENANSTLEEERTTCTNKVEEANSTLEQERKRCRQEVEEMNGTFEKERTRLREDLERVNSTLVKERARLRKEVENVNSTLEQERGRCRGELKEYRELYDPPY